MARYGKCVLLAVVCLALSCLAGSGAQKEKSDKDKPSGDGPDPVGVPKNMTAGKDDRVAVWFAKGKWHLKTVSKDNTPGGKREKDVFSGRVTVEGGKITGYDFKNLEKSKKAANADYVFLHPNGQGFDFQFITLATGDSLNFEVAPEAKNVHFNFAINGIQFPARVLIGAKGENPKKLPFSLPATPKE